MLKRIPSVLALTLALVACPTAPDTTNPSVAFTEPGGTVDLPAVTVKGTAADNRGVVRLTYRLGSGAEQDATARLTGGRFELPLSNLPDGETSLTVTAYDAAGRRSEASLTVRVRPRVQTLGFGAFNGRVAELRAAGVRVFGPGSSVAQDLEPEYVAVAADSKTAYATLQENNAVAILDLEKGEVKDIVALGFKDHSLAGNGLDPSDRDGGANVSPWPVRGMYQPDAIAAFSAGGQTYLVTANEGDARDYAAFKEEKRVKDLALDPVAFPNGAALKADAALGRLTVTDKLGDPDGDGDFDALYAFGARSISVLDASGRLVFDSGDALEQLLKNRPGVIFNAGNTNNTLDDRSDNKGPEPEGVTVGTVGSRTFAFVGLERVGGVASFDLADPGAPRLVAYANDRDFAADPRTPAAKDLGPEGVLFIPASQGPDGRPLLVLANEVSGTTSVFAVGEAGELTSLGRYTAPGDVFDKGAAEIAAYDFSSKRLFVVNGAAKSLDILSLANPAQPALVRSVALAPYGESANSVAARNGMVAVAVQATDPQANGKAIFLDTEGNLRAQVEVGALPDMITFSPDGRLVLVANEGEPRGDYTFDPEGSVSAVNVARLLAP